MNLCLRSLESHGRDKLTSWDYYEPRWALKRKQYTPLLSCCLGFGLRSLCLG